MGLEGSAVFKGHASKHYDDLYEGWRDDLQECGLLSSDLVHKCIWSSSGVTQIAAAKRLAEAGLVVLEDTHHGPMVTRTWRGSYALIRG